MNVDGEMDPLFQVPLADFIAARNALASRLRVAGEVDAAARVKALPKPSVSVWVVNQLYWAERETFDALMVAGGRLRRAQRESGGPDVIREAMRQRREALTAAGKRAEALLGAAGHAPTPATMLRVGKTLEALAGREDAAAPPPGRLTADLDPPGFGALAGLAPPLTPPPASPILLVAEGAPVEPARAGLARAEQALRARQEEAAAGSARLDAALLQMRTAERLLEEARNALARGESAVREARDAVEVTQRRADESARARAQAESDLADARRALQGGE